MKEVLIKFETKEQADQFMVWLCNSGEQDYFQAMEDTEEAHVDNFDYDFENNIINGK